MNVLDPLAWSVLLMFAGCALVVLEVFVPSGGILGFLAFSSVLASIVLAFYHRGPAAGFAISATAVFLLPLTIVLALKYWPHTAMGKRFLLGLPTDEEVLPQSEKRDRLKKLVGKVGVAKTPMLPSGAVRIEGHTIDAVSQGMPIDAGQSVKVIEVKANRVVVRPVDAGETQVLSDEDDLLAQPLDQLGIEPLDDPLG
jgi:membrane-bound serine protease (ClpP class)